MGTFKIEKLKELHPELVGKLQTMIKDRVVKVPCASCDRELGEIKVRSWKDNRTKKCANPNCDDKENTIDFSAIDTIISEIGRM